MRFSKINLALLFLSSDGKLRCSNSNASNVTGEPSLKAAGSHVSPFLSRSALDFREPLLLSRRGDYLWKSVEALSVPTDQCEGCPFLTVCMAPRFRLGPRIPPWLESRGAVTHLSIRVVLQNSPFFGNPPPIPSCHLLTSRAGLDTCLPSCM